VLGDCENRVHRMGRSILSWRPYLFVVGALAIVWSASEFVCVRYAQFPRGPTWEGGVADGGIWIYQGFWRAYSPPHYAGLHTYPPNENRDYGLELPWFELSADSPIGIERGRLPLWTIMLAILLVGGWRYRSRLRDTTIRCASCEYILVGNTSGICPECGTPIPEAVKAALNNGGAIERPGR
jgi:hypothetical protein